jgi:hypothetical protein
MEAMEITEDKAIMEVKEEMEGKVSLNCMQKIEFFN